MMGTGCNAAGYMRTLLWFGASYLFMKLAFKKETLYY